LLSLIPHDFVHKFKEGNMSRFLVAMFVGATIAAAASTIGIGMALPGQKSQWSNWHRLGRHTGKSAVDLVAPVHTPRRGIRLGGA
jgi:hypothetical protein